MSKIRERSMEEHYKGIIKKQQSEIRNLRKQLNHKNKELNKLESFIPSDEEFEEVMVKLDEKPTCPKCSKDAMKFIDLGSRVLAICNECGYRKSRKK